MAGSTMTGRLSAFDTAGLLITASIVLAVVTPRPIWATEASRWDGDSRAAVRLIAGTARGDGRARVFRAGIELKLGTDWKMYWRYPGDAGVPPRFDFSGSNNVSEISVLWPAPMRVSEDGIHLNVYQGRAVLPLTIVPTDPARSVIIRLKLDYGICETFCILMEARSELVLSGKPSAHELVLAAAERRVPRTLALGARDRLSILSIRRDYGTTPSRMVVEVATSEDESVNLFVEGPTADWTLPVPKQISDQAGLRRFAFDLNGVPPGVDSKGAVLRLTAVTAEQAVEVFAAIE